MNKPDFAALLGPALAGAIEQRGFTALTQVQEAVLDPKLAGRDLRISSQTGSGKTVAIGFALRAAVEAVGSASAPKGGVATPIALVIVPTRELAKQVDEELSWLFAPLGAKVASVTGGSGYRDERRAFAAGPAVVVATPGRLLDHLNRGSVDPTQIRAVVLDEADRMLDLGFREDLEAILAFAPTPHTTHLVSATFPQEVKALANRVQTSPVQVEGTPLGTANADIDHIVHLVSMPERVAAIVNLLLSDPDSKTLIFARMRSEVTEIAKELRSAGFSVRPLSGEMEQPERNRALADFKRGTLHALVATDVAARGIDVQDITHVIHAEPPTDVDSYTHRSGRTGRAGRKGISSVLTPPEGLTRTNALLRRAGVRARVEFIPSADEIRAQRQERLFTDLSAEAGDLDPRCLALAERLTEAGAATRAMARLLAKVGIAGPAEPRDVSRHVPKERPSRAARPTAQDARPRGRDAGRPTRGGEWVTFRVTWGALHGADPRRLLAMVCRRGGIQGSDVGSIDVAKTHSFVDVAKSAAAAFEQATRAPDPRDPRVTIRPAQEGAPREGASRDVPRKPRDLPPPAKKAPAKYTHPSGKFGAKPAHPNAKSAKAPVKAPRVDRAAAGRSSRPRLG